MKISLNIISGWQKKHTRFVRLVNATVGTFQDIIYADRPNEADLIPVGFRVAETSLFPELGDLLEVSGIHVHNYSDVDWSGHVAIHIKLSKKPITRLAMAELYI